MKFVINEFFLLTFEFHSQFYQYAINTKYQLTPNELNIYIDETNNITNTIITPRSRILFSLIDFSHNRLVFQLSQLKLHPKNTAKFLISTTLMKKKNIF